MFDMSLKSVGCKISRAKNTAHTDQNLSGSYFWAAQFFSVRRAAGRPINLIAKKSERQHRITPRVQNQVETQPLPKKEIPILKHAGGWLWTNSSGGWRARAEGGASQTRRKLAGEPISGV